MSIAIRVKLNESVYVGDDERRWTLVEVAGGLCRLAGPEGRLCDISCDNDVELEPQVFVRLGRGERVPRLEFFAPRHVPVHTEATQKWIEARRGDM